jgi:protein-disulfide isomerase
MRTEESDMRKRLALAAVILLLLSLHGPPGLAQQSDDLTQLKKEVEALREGQKALESELQDIKNVLRARQAPRQPSPQETLAQPVAIKIDGAPFLGARDARLALVEFTDYQCPFCARHTQQTKPQIVKEYVDTGKLKYILRDHPIAQLHPGASKAHEAAHCAGEQAKYWPMHDLLFSNIRAQGPQELAAHARSLGLDAKRFEQCLASEKYAARVQEGVDAGQAAGVRGTPTFLLGVVDGDTVKATRMIRGALPYPAFKSAIDSLLAEVK